MQVKLPGSGEKNVIALASEFHRKVDLSFLFCAPFRFEDNAFEI